MYIINKIINQIFGYSNIIKDGYINHNNSLDIHLNIDFNIYIKTNISLMIIN